MNLQEMHDKYPIKLERERKMNQEKLKIIRSDAGKLACLTPGTLASSAFQAIVALHSSKDRPQTVNTLL